MTPSRAQDVVRAALGLARDAAEGRLDPARLDDEVTAACRELFGVVVSEDDPLWPVQIDVARQVIAAGGVTLDEMDEWMAVLRGRESTEDA